MQGKRLMTILRRLRSFVGHDGKTSPSAAIFTQAAQRALAERQFRNAAAFYVEAIRLSPDRADLHVQAGHMFKEAGLLDRAEHHYLEADRLNPDDPDLALQFGHFYKVAGRIPESAEAYARAAALMPGNAEIAQEVTHVKALGWALPSDADGLAVASENPLVDQLDRPLLDPRLIADYGRLAPEQMPRPFRQLVRRSEPSLNIQQFGVRLNTYWGVMPVARGVEAIRGFCISTETLTTVTALINGIAVKKQPVKGPYELEYEPDPGRIHKYVFNIWLDFSALRPGRHSVELRFEDDRLQPRSLHQDFVVEPPLREADFPDSDAIVDPPTDPSITLEESINTRPSAVHEAERPTMLPAIRSILVMRADQLGDLVASIPGILRLRELFPAAKLVGAMGPANADLARSLGVFDAVEIVDFRESMVQRTRVLSLEDQEELRARLAPYQFDIAIDLSQSLMSRALLALSGAPFLYGFHDPNWPRLTASVNDAYHDPKNRREIASHSTRIMTMIDRLASLLQSSAKVIRRDHLDRGRLAAFGIGEGERYAVLHTGARIIFSRWAHYPELADRLHRDTDLKVVIFTDHADYRSLLDPAIAQSDRFIIMKGQLPFDDFDALLSFCSLYVGNDSGPKHLASLRGVPVVSIHSARINWSEWGQEHSGVIVTRKLPCAGCSIYHDVDECGKEFVCITAITFDDVYAAVRRYV